MLIVKRKDTICSVAGADGTWLGSALRWETQVQNTAHLARPSATPDFRGHLCCFPALATDVHKDRHCYCLEGTAI